MKKIDVSTAKHPNTFALVDDEDFDRLNKFKWYAARQSTGVLYAIRIPWIKGGKDRKTVFMHKEILTPPHGLFTDHINHDGLDNRKENLRHCNTSQNSANKRKQKAKTYSSYKGVSKYKDRKSKPWHAQIKKDGKSYYLGTFATDTEAAIVYNKKAKELFGEFACLNEIT